MTLRALSEAVEALLVERNPRGMAALRRALAPGYGLRAARHLHAADAVLIGTGFPVADTFETDGPAGAIALYRALEALGKRCHLACARPLAAALGGDFQVLELRGYERAAGAAEARAALAAVEPDAVVSIECPGRAADGRYYNMRGQDITSRCAVFDYYLSEARCPTIAIGDGGNEVGMGRVAGALAALDIRGASTACDELLVADVSNWGAYALIALLAALSGRPLLAAVDHRGLLSYLSERGSVDGVTGENTLSEDGLPLDAGLRVLRDLRALSDQARRERRTEGEA